MRQKNVGNQRPGINGAIRYSEAFKLAVVRELEQEDLPFGHVERKYGIKGCGTVQRWVRQYGDGSRGKVIRVQRPEEIDEVKRLRERVRRLETVLADANVDLALERAYTRLACERAGIQDVEAFKKKPLGRWTSSRRAGRAARGRECQWGVPQVGDYPAELLRATTAAAEPGHGG